MKKNPFIVLISVFKLFFIVILWAPLQTERWQMKEQHSDCYAVAIWLVWFSSTCPLRWKTHCKDFLTDHLSPGMQGFCCDGSDLFQGCFQPRGTKAHLIHWFDDIENNVRNMLWSFVTRPQPHLISFGFYGLLCYTLLITIIIKTINEWISFWDGVHHADTVPDTWRISAKMHFSCNCYLTETCFPLLPVCMF